MAGPRQDSYGYDADTREWFSRFDLRPASVDVIDDRRDAGMSLETVDVPSHLGRQMISEVEVGVDLYRLVQLFGTPNVPDLEAGGGARERDRYHTTWQYLFDVTYDRADDDGDVPESFLLSVYDFDTDASCGISAWRDDGAGEVLEPVEDAADAEAVDLPPEEFLVGLVQLVLNVIEEPVPATYEERWV